MNINTYTIANVTLSYPATMRHLGEPGYCLRDKVANLAIGASITIGSMTVRRVA